MAKPPAGPLANAPRDDRDDFVGTGDSVIADGPPPRWPPKPRKITKDTFHAKVSGEGSIPRADRKPHFRKGGFVTTGRADGGNVSRETSGNKPPVTVRARQAVIAPKGPTIAPARPVVRPAVRPVVRRPVAPAVPAAAPIMKDGGVAKRQLGGGMPMSPTTEPAWMRGQRAAGLPIAKPAVIPDAPAAVPDVSGAGKGLVRKDGGKTK